MENLLNKIILGLVVLAIAAGPSAARADSAANARAEAKKHFDRAKELNEDGQTAEAVIELKRCYELSPHHTCGVKTDGTIACWGRNNEGQATAAAGTFASVSAGKTHTCGVRTDGKIVCWGDDSSGQATPPRM